MKTKIEVPAKNRENTKRRFLDAVGFIIENEGFKGLGVNKVANNARVSKVLIYRYFGGFEQLLKAYILEKDFWSNYPVENLMLDEIALPIREMINNILSEHFNEFYEHCDLKARAIVAIENNYKMINQILENKASISESDGANIVSLLLLAGTDHLVLQTNDHGTAKDDANRKMDLQKSMKQIVDWSFRQ